MQNQAQAFHWSWAQQIALPSLKPGTETISLRLPQRLLDSIKATANARDILYRSLVRIGLQEKLRGH